MRLPVRVCLLACLCALTANPVAAATISIRADEWLPYNGPSRGGPPGYMIEMAQQIAAAAGHTIDYRHLPWDDVIEGVRAGAIDCLVGASASEVEGFAMPELSWGVSQSAAFAIADVQLPITDEESLKGLRLAVIPGYTYGDVLDPWVEENASDPSRIIRIDSGGRAAMSAISRLVAKQADVFIEDRNVMAHTLQQLGMSRRLSERIPVGEADPIYIACTPADPRGAAYAKMFGDGTRTLRESGELAKILQRYGLNDWLQLE